MLGRWRRRREKSINVNIVAKAMCFKHKGAHHHKTWLCKEVAPILVKVELRRKLSSTSQPVMGVRKKLMRGEKNLARRTAREEGDCLKGEVRKRMS